MPAPASIRGRPAVRRFWRALVRPLIGWQPTPFYLFSVAPVRAALAELDRHLGHLPVRHWLSCKTQPLPSLLCWWRRQGRPIEVVSEFELQAALAEGFPPEDILVNGPAKHHWLPRHPVPGLRMNFDSLNEVGVLAPLARRLGWTVGLRLNTSQEFDPDTPAYPTQFGLVPREAARLLKLAQRLGLRLEIAHFHLRSNVASARIYDRALAEVAAFCRSTGWTPRYADCGGGFPPPGVWTRTGRPLDADFRLREMARVYARAQQWIPGVEEFWLENGRWLTARSGVLVVKVLDAKARRGMRHLICDGGRTLHALVSLWEQHDLASWPPRGGPMALTTVTGPTCMAFDQLARRPLPVSIRPGDHLIWFDAGAYHLPWETRFSHGRAAVYWHDGHTTRQVRERDSFARWRGAITPQHFRLVDSTDHHPE